MSEFEEGLGDDNEEEESTLIGDLEAPVADDQPDNLDPELADRVLIDDKMNFISQLRSNYALRYGADVTVGGIVVTKNDAILFAFIKVLFRQPLTHEQRRPTVPPIVLASIILAKLSLAGKSLTIKDGKNEVVSKDVRSEFSDASKDPYRYFLDFQIKVELLSSEGSKAIAGTLRSSCPIAISDETPMSSPSLAAKPTTFGKMLARNAPGIYAAMLMYQSLSRFPSATSSENSIRRELVNGAQQVVAVSTLDLNTIRLDNISASRAIQYAIESELDFNKAQSELSDRIYPFFSDVINDIGNCLLDAKLIGPLVPDFKTAGSIFDSVNTLQAAMLAASELSFLRPQIRMFKLMAARLTDEGIERDMDKYLYLANATCGYPIISVLESPEQSESQLLFNTRLNPESTGVLCMMTLASIDVEVSLAQLLRVQESSLRKNITEAVEYYARTVPFFRVLLAKAAQGGTGISAPRAFRITTSMVIEAFKDTWTNLVSMTTYPGAGSNVKLSGKPGADRDRELADTIFSLALGANGWNALNASYLPPSSSSINVMPRHDLSEMAELDDAF
jgi:hypothetical protein